ncbi:MAG: hypothetical protein ACLTBF_00435 [Christensenellales bacterium]
MNVSDMNLRVLQIMSMALSGWARQIDAADVQTLARECGVDEREAVIQLFAAQCGVEDREKIERYFRLSIEKVDADAFCATLSANRSLSTEDARTVEARYDEISAV